MKMYTTYRVRSIDEESIVAKSNAETDCIPLFTYTIKSIEHVCNPPL